ncbi:MAG: signal peptide peptidase SppA [Actinomycetota bacterium]
MAQKKGKWALIITAIVLVAGLWIGAFVYLIARAGGRSGAADFDETLIEEGTGGKVALIEVAGVITSAPSDPYSVIASDKEIVDQLDQAIEDDDVVAVIVDLDTPGGEVVASDNIHRKVSQVREADKPVIALMQATAASGGYYIAAGADEIVANSQTITGSIGVILTLFDVQGAARKLGVEEIVIKSGPHKDIGSPFRDLPPEEAAILQRLIDEAYGQFVGIVAEGRGLSERKVRELADGRIYSGKQAKDLDLVDHLGSREEALERARDLAGVPDASLVRYERSYGLGELLAPLGKVGDGFLERETGMELRPGLKYLWLF